MYTSRPNPQHNPDVITIQDPGFFASTMGYFALALLITCGGTFGGFSLLSAFPELFMNPLVFYGAFAAEILLVWTSRSWSKNLPLGYGMFVLYATLSGFTLVPILALAGAVGGVGMIMKALFASVCVFGACALYGWTTHRNLQGMGGFLMMSLLGLITVSILGIFFPWSNTMEMVVAGTGVLIFSGFTMYDLQNLQKGMYSNALVAAIHLYLDFINLFVSLLRLMLAFTSRD